MRTAYHSLRSVRAASWTVLGFSLVGTLSGCPQYAYLPPDTSQRLVIRRGVDVTTQEAGKDSGDKSRSPITAEEINVALNKDQVRIPMPNDVTQAALFVPPATFDEAYRNLAWRCTLAERKRLQAADVQYLTFIGLLSAGLCSSTAAATFAGLTESTSDDTAKTAFKATGIVMGGLAVIFNSLMASTAIRRTANATRAKFGEAQLALGEAQAEWPLIDEACKEKLSGSAAERAISEEDKARAVTQCANERRRKILVQLSSRCLAEPSAFSE